MYLEVYIINLYIKVGERHFKRVGIYGVVVEKVVWKMYAYDKR